MAATDLVQLIDLSLGAEPRGVVNFNYLHGLLHEIVKRLVNLERLPLEGVGLYPEGVSGGADTLKEEETEVSLEFDRERSLSPAERTLSGASVIPGGSSMASRRMTSGYVQSMASLASAANDLGALERKLQDLESRVNTMETLPEMLERKSSDDGATPVADMWNFTNINKRLGAAEEGLDKVTLSLLCSGRGEGVAHVTEK